MRYAEYWVKNGNRWTVILSILFSFSLGEAVDKLVYRIIKIDSFILTSAIGIGTIYFVWFVLGYLKKNNILKI